MDVWHITVAVLRRWYVFFPLVALTLLAAIQVGNATPTQHEVSTTAILVPGSGSSEIDGPYGSRSDTTQVLAIVLDATEAREDIKAQGLNPDYEVDTRDRSAIMNLTVLGETPQEGLTTSAAVLDLARQELAQRQDAAKIPPSAQITMQVLQSPFVSDVVAEGKLRNMVIVGIVGAALSLLVAILFDDLAGLLKRWRRHGRERRVTKNGSSDQPRTRRGTSGNDNENTKHHETPAQAELLDEGDPTVARVSSAETARDTSAPREKLHTDRAQVDQPSSD